MTVVSVTLLFKQYTQIQKKKKMLSAIFSMHCEIVKGSPNFSSVLPLCLAAATWE
jgi:hypothetical protein